MACDLPCDKLHVRRHSSLARSRLPGVRRRRSTTRRGDPRCGGNGPNAGGTQRLELRGAAAKAAEKRITTLVCGAISQPLQVQLAGRGIEVISGICGNIDEVLDGFRTGRLREERFAMPGCGRLPATRPVEVLTGGCRTYSSRSA